MVKTYAVHQLLCFSHAKNILKMALHGSQWMTLLLNCKMKSFSSACHLNGKYLSICLFSVQLSLFCRRVSSPFVIWNIKPYCISHYSTLHDSHNQLNRIRHYMLWLMTQQMLTSKKNNCNHFSSTLTTITRNTAVFLLLCLLISEVNIVLNLFCM